MTIFYFQGFLVTIRRHGWFTWRARAIGPGGGLWRSSSAWTRWGARREARWVISHYLLPGLKAVVLEGS